MSIVLIIVVLAVRKTIYFSPRLVREDFTLAALLQRWRIIDIVLLSFAEVIAIFGLVITLLGMPFARTFHFFVSGFLLTMINDAHHLEGPGQDPHVRKICRQSRSCKAAPGPARAGEGRGPVQQEYEMTKNILLVEYDESTITCHQRTFPRPGVRRGGRQRRRDGQASCCATTSST